MEEKLNKFERWIVRIVLLALLVLFSIAIYSSCSSNINFIKGKNHNINEKQTTSPKTDAKLEDIELNLRKHQQSIDEHKEVQEKIIDTLEQSNLLPKDTIQ